jgi:8-oxo-dGTP diphosphatase
MPEVRTSSRAIICRAGRYLVAHYRDESGDWYTFPGGGQQHGEDLHAALCREISEEVGGQIRIGQLLFVRECLAARHPGPNLPPEFHSVELYFACELLSEACDLGTVPDPNQVGFAWMTADELRQVRFYPAVMPDALAGQTPAYLGVSP